MQFIVNFQVTFSLSCDIFKLRNFIHILNFINTHFSDSFLSSSMVEVNFFELSLEEGLKNEFKNLQQYGMCIKPYGMCK